MAEEPETQAFGCESDDVVAEASQPKGAAGKKKNKWKTVTAEFYQPKPYESDQGKGKASGAVKSFAGKGGAGKGTDDIAGRVGRGGKGRTPQLDDANPPRVAPEEVPKQPLLNPPVAQNDASGGKGAGGDNSPKSKKLGSKSREAKGKGKGKNASSRKGMSPAAIDATQDVDRSVPQQGTAIALRSDQASVSLGQQPAMVHQPMQQMPLQGPAMPQQFPSFCSQGFCASAPGGVVYQNAQPMPAMYAMPYYLPVQMTPAQMAMGPQAAVYASPPFVPAGGHPAGCGGTGTGAPGGSPGACFGPAAKLPEMPLAEGDQAVLRCKVQQQIEYYFDRENLARDMYLRMNMSEEGWVAVWLVAGFRRVECMTTDLPLIVKAIQASSKLELHNGMQFVRPKDVWRLWVMGGTGAAPPQREMPACDLSGSVGAP